MFQCVLGTVLLVLHVVSTLLVSMMTRFSECFDPMTVQIKPLEEAQRAIEARKWIFSSKHEKLVGRLGKVVECDKRDRSILVEHNDGVSEWWCAEALLRRVKATCKSEHPLSEFSCDRREFTCDDCEGRDQKTCVANESFCSWGGWSRGRRADVVRGTNVSPAWFSLQFS